MHLEDLSSWLGKDHPLAERVLAVGWLENGHEYPTGASDESFYQRLAELSQDPWEPFVSGGWHECSLCQFNGARSGSNIYIPAGRILFVAPALVEHYVSAHHYAPPAAFISAVLNSPDMRSQEYRMALVKTGVLKSLVGGT